ncbi:MAG: hypothetical protein JJLCMIEE_02368 [Acidimicrobiales bacterium]|nr:MAG: hypothetical protein EDR02_14040 [Actinomycetota bacterium]MBV6509299.1 hypothetical protein [Acidimicrobiales bacterium]RIK03976.1 MAG: hypothetical protein DCC48_14820 [Acidobacteriota bacterium]
MSEASEARILDRGYRRYEGPRRGVPGAMRSVVLAGIQRALGLKRTFGAKIFPALAVMIAFIPAIVFVGLAIFIPEDVRNQGILPGYGEYYAFIVSAIILFAAFVAPELLCTDRRTGMIGLYLASPLTRDTYLVSKGIAILLVLSVVTLGPPLLMLVAFTLIGLGPDGPVAYLSLFGRMVVAAVAVSGLHTALSLAISSITDRKGVAAAAFILAVLVTNAAADTLILEADASPYLSLMDLGGLPFELVTRIYGEPVESAQAAELGTMPVLAAYLGWTLACLALVRWRYQKLQVSR